MARIIPLPQRIFIDNDGNNPVPISFSDSSSNDAFGRNRISLPQLRCSTIFDTNKRPTFWAETTSGIGAATHLPNESSIRMQVSLNGDEVIRQSKEYFVYRAGQSQLVLATFKMSEPETNLTQEVGYFDANNGIFLQIEDTTVNIVKRTSATGTPIDSKITQSSWNLDPMNGLGRSEIDLDLTKTQILVIDFQWLGVGRVRVGFDIDGVIYYVHEFLHANYLTEVYMSTPKLPIRYRIVATGLLTGTRHMKQICSAVIREGGSNEPDVEHEVRTANSPTNVGTSWETVLGIRLKSSNIRATIRMLGAEVYNEDASFIEYLVVMNPTYAGTPTWFSIDSDGIAEAARFNAAITVDANGISASGHVFPLGGFAGPSSGGQATGGIAISSIEDTIPLAADIAGVSDQVWLCARASTGTADLRGILRWVEER